MTRDEELVREIAELQGLRHGDLAPRNLLGCARPEID